MTPQEHRAAAEAILDDVARRASQGRSAVADNKEAFSKAPHEVVEFINMINLGLQASSTRALAHATLAGIKEDS